MVDQIRPKLVFIGFLSNCDDSILQVKFEDEFIVEKIDKSTGIELLKLLSNSNDVNEVIIRYINTGIFSTPFDSFYFIKKIIEPGIKVDSNTSFIEILKFQKDHFKLREEWDRNVQEKLRLMRLFKEGNIFSPIQFIYIDLKKPIRVSSGFCFNSVNEEKYTLDASEINELHEFINGNKIPFKDSSVNIAFQNFEFSYNINSHGIALVSCMTALECLLSLNNNYKSKEISKNMGALIGKDIESSKEIYDKVSKLYKKRSLFIHTGKSNINIDDLREARNLVRVAIKQFLIANLTKNELIKVLKTKWFAEDRK